MGCTSCEDWGRYSNDLTARRRPLLGVLMEALASPFCVDYGANSSAGFNRFSIYAFGPPSRQLDDPFDDHDD